MFWNLFPKIHILNEIFITSKFLEDIQTLEYRYEYRAHIINKCTNFQASILIFGCAMTEKQVQVVTPFLNRILTYQIVVSQTELDFLNS